MVHVSPFSTSTLRYFSNDVKNTPMRSVLTPTIELCSLFTSRNASFVRGNGEEDEEEEEGQGDDEEREEGEQPPHPPENTRKKDSRKKSKRGMRSR